MLTNKTIEYQPYLQKKFIQEQGVTLFEGDNKIQTLI